MISRLVSLAVTAVALFVLWTFVGKPMYTEYRQTGSVTVPGIGYTIDLKEMLDDAKLPGSSGSTGSSGSRVTPDQALAALNKLEVKGKAPMTGYDREGKFGSAWTDKADGVLYAGNKCDTRNDILKRDLSDTRLDTDKCTVLSGTLNDPYTGKTINFKRGAGSAKVQIDHIVALGNAWVTGAQQWSQDKRVAFANDPANLLAVDGPANGQKSANDASGWLPANKKARCSYASAQVTVKTKYGLWVTAAEKNALAAVLNRCG